MGAGYKFDKRLILADDIDFIDMKPSTARSADLGYGTRPKFLTVVAAGNFISAADRLHVTQSTVSARIHTLEDQLGCTLFVRNKAGSTLTPAGRQFQKHASTLVRTVEQARHDVGVPRGFGAALTVGGRFGLWEQLLLKWLPLMLKVAPDIAVRAEIGLEADLMQGLVEGRLDIGVMYTPQSRPGLKVEPLLEERLVLVSTDPNRRPEPGPGYVYIDWGPNSMPGKRQLPGFHRDGAHGQYRLVGSSAYSRK
jgi:LysR family transcriptional regulator, flagellar master operon regulator